MDVVIEFIAPDGLIWSEEDLAEAGDGLGALLGTLSPLYGRLVISDPSQDEETSITDDLEAMIRELCLRSVAEIVAGEEVVYDLATHPETVRFVPHGDRVAIEGDATPELWCNARALAESFVKAGERYVALKAHQFGTEKADNLEPYLRQAQAAIG